MKLVLGLGNPGPDYAGTRHNVGFEVVDRLARKYGAGAPKSKFGGLLSECEMPAPGGAGGTERTLLLKPMTYMNLSGRSALEAMQFFKLEPSKDMLVVVDDIALPCGTIRVKPDGSSGGHNGLTDIGMKLGSNFWARVRIGVDSPGRVPQSDYVLGRFTPEQQPLMETALANATAAVETWVSGGVDAAANKFNNKTERTNPAKEAPSKESRSKESHGN
jgi:PTH1 family peptidyl-tRNA hydrolase